MDKTFGSWRLFAVFALLISAANCVALPFVDFRTARGTESIILYSVRCALPLFIVAFTASSVRVLWPSRAARWLLTNRRYFGLAFAFGMAWHLAFVFYSFYKFGVRLNRFALTVDVTGVSFLFLLTVTSFRRISLHMKLRDWLWLHKLGIYAIWILATYIYQGSLRADRDLFHFLALGILIAAWLLRVAAWIKSRASSPRISEASTPMGTS